MTSVYTLLRFLLLTMAAIASASADVTYHSYNSIRDWGIPGGDNAVVSTFTVLFGATVWFVARGIWLNDRAAQRRNWMFALVTFIPAIALVIGHALRS
jgi:hypothetical protein